MAPNRTEILHFRATPEEKGRIKENAGHAELHLSEWMRKRSLTTFEDPNLGISHEAVEAVLSTQPVVGDPERERELRKEVRQIEAEADAQEAEGAQFPDDPTGSVAQALGETYEQFMERRVGELGGETAGDMGRQDATEEAEAEWAQR